jgi:hypothetical protein
MRAWFWVLFLIVTAAAFTGCGKDDPQPDQPTGPVPFISIVSPLSGPKGTQVDIKGRDFFTQISRVSVYINNKRIQPSLLSDTLIRVVVPPRCGSGRIIVTMDQQVLSGPVFQFIYTATVLHYSGVPGVAGYADADALNSRFNQPRGITMDAFGNLYVADELNHSIRRIATDGSVSSFAGNGMPGHAEGTGNNARFSHPHDVDYDITANNFYVADKLNHCIRKITFTGLVSTVAGVPGAGGYVDGAGPLARLRFPTGLALEGELVNLYVADAGNHCIRKLEFNGIMSTFAGSNVPGQGDAIGTGARFGAPFDIAYDTTGFLYVCDTLNNNIRRISRVNASVTTLAGSGVKGWADGSAAGAAFNAPAALSSRYGQVLVCDWANHRIRMVDQSGNVTTVTGNGTPSYQNGTGTGAGFFNPGGIVRTPEGDYFVSDTYNHCIRKIILD